MYLPSKFKLLQMLVNVHFCLVATLYFDIDKKKKQKEKPDEILQRTQQ